MWTSLVVGSFLPLLALTDNFYKNDVLATADAVADITTFLHWSDALFVYDESLSPQERQSLVAVLADYHVGIVTLELFTSQTDVIASLVSAIQSTTITSVLLCLDSSTLLMFLKQAKEAAMLHQHYEWLVMCARLEPKSLEKLLCCAPRNVALVAPALVQNGSTHAAVSHSMENHRVPLLLFQPHNLAVFSYNLQTAKFHHVASWTPKSRLKVFSGVIFPDLFRHFNNATLRIGTWEALPFSIQLSTNGTLVYSGFCFDILDEMARYLNFSYTLVEPPDGQYGAPEDNGTWNGMVGMLMRGEIDMAVGPFSITPDRKSVVDFTIPFMEDGGGILTKGGDPDPDLLNIFRPFPLTVWFLLGASVVVISVILFAITKVRNLDFFNVSKQHVPFTLEECFLVIFGSLMCQGAIRHPVSSAGRLVLGCWWLFTILIVSIYTASLAALLTVRVQGQNVDSIQDLAASSLTPITLQGTSWWTLFMKADRGVYGTVGQRMASSPVVKTYDEAMELVYAGTAAFVIDVNQVNYLYRQDCKNLHVAATTFINNGIGFALPKHAYYREAMSNIILKLQEGGFLGAWKRRWWQMLSDCGTDGPSVEGSRRLHIIYLGGILIVYAVTVLLSLLCLLLQCLLHSRRSARLRRSCSAPGLAPADEGGDQQGSQTTDGT